MTNEIFTGNNVSSGKVIYPLKSVKVHAGKEFVELEINYENRGWELMTLDIDTAYELSLKLGNAVNAAISPSTPFFPEHSR